jgi:pimeloyl-ACP methyl ester carboxylesterase
LLPCVPAFALDQAPKSYWAKFENNNIRYYDIGHRKNKTAIVFVHCWTCNADFWDASYNAFPEYRVIAMDLVGHGQSDKPKAEYSMEYFAKSVEAVLKRAGVEKAVLVGHSMGTPVIRQFYRLYPSQVIGLVIVDGGLRPFGPKAQIEKFFEPMFTDYSGQAPKFIDGNLGSASPELRKRVKTEMLKTPDHVAIGAMRGMMDETIFAVDKINVPLLAILASSSFGQQKDIESFLRSLASDLEFRMWNGVSHFLMMERPKEFNEELRLFIKQKKLL